jgi:hypothetical protein
MEPLLTSRATISGLPVEYILTAQDSRFWQFNDREVTLMQRRQTQIKVSRFAFHDGTAVFSREVLRHGIKYPDVTVGQKVIFMIDLVDAGEKAKRVDNRRHFVYVRHGSNTWTFKEWQLLDRVSAPRWFPKSELDFFREAAA